MFNDPNFGWRKVNTTAATSTQRISVNAVATLFVQGTFDSGTIRVHPIIDGAATSGYLYQLDGSTKVATIPPGQYAVTLTSAGSNGNVDVLYSTHTQFTIGR